MKFIGLLARSGHAASERGGRRAEGCERARRAAFRVPTEPKNLRPHGARLVRFIPSWTGGSAAVEADRHRPSEIRKHKSLISFFAQSHRNRQSPERRKAVKIRRLLATTTSGKRVTSDPARLFTASHQYKRRQRPNHRPASQVVVNPKTLQEHNEKAPSSWLSS